MNKIKLRKRILVLALLISTVLATINVPVKAKSNPISGSGGKYIIWYYNKTTKTLSFTGRGSIEENEGVISDDGGIGSWWCWKEDVKHIVIGEGITEIGEADFVDFEHIYSISLPKSLIKIEDYAFNNAGFCGMKLTIPSNVKKVGKWAFDAESLFKTLKYVPNYQPAGFNSLSEARLWVRNFVNWYNNEHRHSGINYVTPAERHEGKDIEILEKRKEVYEKAKQGHPERWSREIRNWDYSETEWLNPRQETEETKGTKVS